MSDKVEKFFCCVGYVVANIRSDICFVNLDVAEW